ncbi:hypothetical protein HNR44_001559 [Geomicrobium halophilum]|uniref:Uncharacterized protein n=1 Tax=Geomicrobium halophilum TaxID=549000 RepID=A0A841PLG7_9BACL|nr:hypothetical protein [Geomicrobium halophilum]MBB6449610.1 hypothetical protein [Geomicrobium halophilum]
MANKIAKVYYVSNESGAPGNTITQDSDIFYKVEYEAKAAAGEYVHVYEEQTDDYDTTYYTWLESKAKA